MIAATEEAIWHDVECGGYGADLALWEDLAAAAAWGADARAEVLELGCGTGRVALHLARRGHRVTGVDVDSALVGVLAERAAGAGAEVEVVTADIRRLDLGRRFGLVAGPMQIAQMLDTEGRARMLEGVAAHLAPGAIAALAILDSEPEPWRASFEAPAPAPDVREIDGWVYSSLPLALEPDGEAIALRRLRQTVSPEGDLTEKENVVRIWALSPEDLEREAAAVGLRPRERRSIDATDDHLGSTIVALEAEG
jgi:SAM-dependent methyltransferase